MSEPVEASVTQRARVRLTASWSETAQQVRLYDPDLTLGPELVMYLSPAAAVQLGQALIAVAAPRVGVDNGHLRRAA